MDDLKLIGRSEEELRNDFKIVKTFSDAIKMKFELEKCARISWTHQHSTKSALLKPANKFKKYFQSETKANKKYSNSEYKRENGKKKGCIDNFHVA
jgi:hypothetical protein